MILPNINTSNTKYIQEHSSVTYKISSILLKAFIILYLLQNVSFADNIITEEVSEIEKEDTTHAKTLVLGELLLIVNAAMASYEPSLFGGLMLFLAPYGAATAKDTTTQTKWTLFVAGEGIAAYNIYAGENHFSQAEIFRDNIIAWHLYILSSYISEEIFSDDNKFFGILPHEDGAKIFVSYKF